MSTSYVTRLYIWHLQVRMEGAQPSLTLFDPEQLTHIGAAADFGTCRSTRKVRLSAYLSMTLSAVFVVHKPRGNAGYCWHRPSRDPYAA